jgi:hypothetical protein
MFSDCQLAEPPGAPRQRPTALVCAFGMSCEGRQMLSADGCAVRVDNPASRFCAVWVPGAAGE